MDCHCLGQANERPCSHLSWKPDQDFMFVMIHLPLRLPWIFFVHEILHPLFTRLTIERVASFSMSVKILSYPGHGTSQEKLKQKQLFQQWLFINNVL